MVHYLGYPTSKTAMLFYVSHYRIRLLKQLYLLACGYNFRGASYFVWLTLFIAQGSRYILTTAVVTLSCFAVIGMPVYVMLTHTRTSIFIFFMPWCLMV